MVQIWTWSRSLLRTTALLREFGAYHVFANPTGITYSDEVVRAFANLKPAAPDFRIFWDNAYAIHAFVPESEAPQLLNIFDALAEVAADDAQKNLVIAFASTAKVTFPSSGMAWVAASPADIKRNPERVQGCSCFSREDLSAGTCAFPQRRSRR